MSRPRLPVLFALLLLPALAPTPAAGAEAETLELDPASTRTLRDERLDQPSDPKLAAVGGHRRRSVPPPDSGRVRIGTKAVSTDGGRRAIGRTGNLIERSRGYVRFDLRQAEKRIADGREVKLAFLDFVTRPSRAVHDEDTIEPNSEVGCRAVVDRISVLETSVDRLRPGLPVEGFKGPAGTFHRLSPKRYDVTAIVRGWLHDRKPNHGMVLSRTLLPANAKRVAGSPPRRANARRRWEMGWLRQKAYKVHDSRYSQMWRYTCLHELSGFKLTVVLTDPPERKPLALQDWTLRPVHTDTIGSAEKNGSVPKGLVPANGYALGGFAHVVTPPPAFDPRGGTRQPEEMRVLLGTWAASQDRDQPLGRTHTTNILNRYRGYVKFDLGLLARTRGAARKLRTALLRVKVGPGRHRPLREQPEAVPNSPSGCTQGAVIETISVPTARHTLNAERDPQGWRGERFETGSGFHKLSPTQYDITEIVRHWLQGHANHGMWLGARVYPADGYTELTGGGSKVGKHRQRRADMKWLRQPGYRLPDANEKMWRFVCLAELHSFELVLLFDKE
ncbi:MAG: hypothetical protein QNJ98_08830 [Planctomycetota bacterium]|nr:hypothetical protein [Planctomycetota bacterium]